MIPAGSRELAPRVAGRRVLVTRAGDAAEAWREELERLGAVCVQRGVLATETLAANGNGFRTRDALRGCDWLVLTSARAVAALEEIAGEPLAVPAPVAVVGPATAERARRAGLDVRLQAKGGTVVALAEEMAEVLAAATRTSAAERPLVVFAGAEDAHRGLEVLETRGLARVVRLAVYRTIPAPPVPEAQREELDVDVVLLASPSAVRGLVAGARLPARARIITIGPSTTAAAREAGLTVAGEAVTRDLAGLLRAIPEENGT